jgi:predicted transcriptional regulator
MAIHDIDWSEAVSMTEEADEETLAAIDRGIKDADEGRLFTVEEARERLSRWLTSSSEATLLKPTHAG